MTNREAFEHAAGAPLGDNFFIEHNIDPDAVYTVPFMAPEDMTEQWKSDTAQKIISRLGGCTGLAFPVHVYYAPDMYEVVVRVEGISMREVHYCVCPGHGDLEFELFLRRLVRVAIKEAYEAGARTARKRMREALGIEV